MVARKVVKVTSDEDDLSERQFRMQLSDGTSSPFKLVKDGEWVLQGDGNQRYSPSELRAILVKLDALNGARKRAPRPSRNKKR